MQSSHNIPIKLVPYFQPVTTEQHKSLVNDALIEYRMEGF